MGSKTALDIDIVLTEKGNTSDSSQEIDAVMKKVKQCWTGTLLLPLSVSLQTKL